MSEWPLRGGAAWRRGVAWLHARPRTVAAATGVVVGGAVTSREERESENERKRRVEKPNQRDVSTSVLQ